ncbi:MAG: phosphoglycerate mutase family protein [Terriglobales bacterium]
MNKSLRMLQFALLLTALGLSSAAQMPATPPAAKDAPAPFAKTTTIYIVRHAEKASASGDTPLSEAGIKRAACLTTTLADANIQSIYTTEYKRTKETAAPTATKTGVTATVINGAEMDKLIKTLQSETGRNVLVVGHSNTVPQIVARLGAGAVTVKDDEFDHLYIVTLRNGEASLASLRYCH